MLPIYRVDFRVILLVPEAEGVRLWHGHILDVREDEVDVVVMEDVKHIQDAVQVEGAGRTVAIYTVPTGEDGTSNSILDERYLVSSRRELRAVPNGTLVPPTLMDSAEGGERDVTSA